MPPPSSPRKGSSDLELTGLIRCHLSRASSCWRRMRCPKRPEWGGPPPAPTLVQRQDERAVDLLTGQMQCEVKSGRTAPGQPCPDPRLRGGRPFAGLVVAPLGHDCKRAWGFVCLTRGGEKKWSGKREPRRLSGPPVMFGIVGLDRQLDTGQLPDFWRYTRVQWY